MSDLTAIGVEGTIRIYVLDEGAFGPRCVASCDEDAVIFTIRTLREERQITDGDCIGILERDDDDETGVWLVNPWTPTPFGTRT